MRETQALKNQGESFNIYEIVVESFTDFEKFLTENSANHIIADLIDTIKNLGINSWTDLAHYSCIKNHKEGENIEILAFLGVKSLFMHLCGRGTSEQICEQIKRLGFPEYAIQAATPLRLETQAIKSEIIKLVSRIDFISILTDLHKK